MAYDAPTVEQFKERFPRFADADEYFLELLLAEALTQVDDSWVEADYANAILYLMAHLYAMETGSQADRPGTIVAESFAGLSVSYGTGNVASASNYDATEYGRRYAALRKRSFPPIASI